MQKSLIKLDKFKKALLSLEAIYNKPIQEDRSNIDATIRRFEFTFELFWRSLKDLFYEQGIRPLRKLASGSEVQGAHGTEDRSVFNIHEDLSTGATTQFAVEVEFPKRSIELNYPKEIIKQAYASKLIDDESLWLQMLKDRNLTSHTYDEALANEIFKNIKLYVPLFKKSLLQIEKLHCDL
jgi:nucleotidyltransferase substrate binding protein (TIGR01987 family)